MLARIHFRLGLSLLFLLLAGLGSCSNPLESISQDQYSLYLAGGSYVEVPKQPSLDSLNSGRFTIELFLQPDTMVGEDSPALFMATNDSGGNEIGLYRSRVFDDRLLVYVDDKSVPGVNNVPISGLHFTNGEWMFLAMTYDSGRVAIYVNGKAQIQGALPDSTQIAVGNYPLLIGADLDGQSLGNFWTGAFDEVRLWQDVLSPAEIAFHAIHPEKLSEHYKRGDTPAERLLGLWRFNEGAGTAVTDGSIYGNHGVIVNQAAGEWRAGGMPD